MAQGKTTFILEGEAAKAVDAFLKVVDAQDKTKDGMRKMNREAKKTGQSLDGIGKSIVGWAAGIASIATLRQGLRNVYEETEKIKQSQKEMYDIALTSEDKIMKLAHLRGDVSLENLQKIRKEIKDLALKTSVSFETATSLKFFMESALGTGPSATAATEAALKFAGPARIMPEELALVPAILKKWEAATPKEQSELFSALYGGTRESLADVGQYIPQLMKVQSTAKEYGFNLAQTLALLTTAIEAAGLEKSGQTLMSSMLYGTGRSGKALKYLSKEAKKRGKEWGEMGAVERYWFTADLYGEAREKGPAAEDVFKLAVGGKGYQYFQQMFSETSRRKYEEVLPIIMEKISSDIVDVMAEQFKKLPIAAAARHATLAETGAAVTGEKKSPFAVLSEMTAKMIKQADANVRGWGDIIRFGLTPEKIRMFNMAQNALQENLLLAIRESEAGTPERNKLLQLYRQTYQPSPFFTRRDYLKDVYEATEGFELVGKKGGLVSDEFRREVEIEAGLTGRGRPRHYTRGIEAYYGVPAAEAIEEYMARNVLRENLLLAIKESEAGTSERNKLLQLYRQTYQPSPIFTRRDYLKDVYEATKGFELIYKKGILVSDEFRTEVAREAGTGRDKPRWGIEAYYEVPAAEAMEEHTKAIKKNTETIEHFMELMTTGMTSARLGPDE